MFTRFFAPLLGLAVFASASSLHVARQTEPVVGDWCAGLGGNTVDNLENFTLAAWNLTGNNANATGNPLVLSITSATRGLSMHTWAVSAWSARTQTRN